jgi:hypothetical protein
MCVQVSVVVGEAVIVRDCGGIGRMGVTSKISIIDNSVSGEFGGSGDSEWNGEEEERKVRRGKK